MRSYRDALRSDVKAFAGWFRRMLEQGIYLAPSQFEAIFLSGAHSEKDVDRFLEAADRAFQG